MLNFHLNKVDKDFFEQYQKALLWFANTWIGQRYFRIRPKFKIVRFFPNCYTEQLKTGYFKTTFYTNRRFAYRINHSIRWIPFNVVKPVEIEGRWFLQPKFGLTVSTFFPDPNPETNTVDGVVFRTVTNEAWATIRTSAGTGADDLTNLEAPCKLVAGTSAWDSIYRGIFGFDTSSIPDGDTISAATFEIFGDTKNDNFSQSVVIDRNVPASPTALVAADYNIAEWAGVEQASNRITVASWSNTAYNVFTLNATGLGNISKTGVSWFGTRFSGDFDNSEPTFSASLVAGINTKLAEAAGTSTDPKLVVTHAAVTTTSSSTSSSSTSTSSTSTSSSSTSTSTSSSSSSTTSTSSSTSSTSTSSSSTSTTSTSSSTSSSSTTTPPPISGPHLFPDLEVLPVVPILEARRPIEGALEILPVNPILEGNYTVPKVEISNR